MNNNSEKETLKQTDNLNSDYFTLGVKYLVSGASHCLSLIKACDQESKETRKNLARLVNELKDKIDDFSFNHLKDDIKEEIEASQCDPTLPLKVDKNNTELSTIKERCRKIKKKNRKLKKKVKDLKTRLAKTNYQFLQYIQQAKENSNLRSSQKSRKESPASRIRPNQIEPRRKPPQTRITSNPLETDNKKEERVDLDKLLPNLTLKSSSNKSVQVRAKHFSVREKWPSLNPNILRNLKTKINALYSQNLKSADKKIKEMSLRIEELDNHFEKNFIEGSMTMVAVKNHKSYMIGTMRKGLKLLENNMEVYSARLFYTQAYLRDMIYIEDLDCYLMSYNEKLFRKDIDDQPPYLYLDKICGYRAGACLRYSKMHRRLITCKDITNISAIDLKTKVVTIEVKKNVGEIINDFRVFGGEENGVIAITQDGFVILYHLNHENNTGKIMDHFSVILNEERKEKAKSIAVCDRNEFVFVEIGQREAPKFCSRMLVFRVHGDRLIFRTSIDQLDQKLGEKLAFDCYGYVGSHVLLIGLTKNSSKVIQVFDFDSLTGEFRELVDKRIENQETVCVKITKVGNQFIYSGGKAKLMMLSLMI